MSNNELHNINVASQGVLVTPRQLWEALPMSEAVSSTVADSRKVKHPDFSKDELADQIKWVDENLAMLK